MNPLFSRTPTVGYENEDWTMSKDSFEENPESNDQKEQSNNSNGGDFKLFQPFLQAVCVGHWDTALTLLDQYPDAIRAREPSSGNTVLHIAAASNRWHIVKKLLLELTTEEEIYAGRNFDFTPFAPEIFPIRCSLRFWSDQKKQSNSTDLYMIPLLLNLEIPSFGCLQLCHIPTKRSALRPLRMLNLDNIVREQMMMAVFLKDVGSIKRMVKANPQLMWDNDIARGVLKVAIKLREPDLFSLIHGLPNKVAIASYVDANKDTLLHIAAVSAHPLVLRRISGPALQMQRELQWYKEVENCLSLAAKESKNMESMKPYAIFTESHKALVTEGEKWMKKTSNSSILVATLIATVTFASAFSFPGEGGGKNNQDLDFLRTKLFKAFLISNAVALLASTTSLLMFLGILTSRFAQEDFLRNLPTKLMMGLSTLLVSIEAIVICFCVGLLIVFHQQLWIAIPAISVLHIPVAMYMWRQLPLLFNSYLFTYGPSIFDRNVKPVI